MANADRLTERAAAELGEICVSSDAALAPIIVDVVARIEGKGVICACGDVRSEAARSVGFALHEIPKGDAAGRCGDGIDAIGDRCGCER